VSQQGAHFGEVLRDRGRNQPSNFRQVTPIGCEDGRVRPVISPRLEPADGLKEHTESVPRMLVRTTLTDPAEGAIEFIGSPRVIGWETRTFE
jgi:hypothetical protein